MGKKEIIADLKKYYKYVFECIKCGVPYGCDHENEAIKLCPNCEEIKKKAKAKRKKQC